MDLAKVGEVMVLSDEHEVNGWLKGGWVLLTVRVVDGPQRRSSEVLFVLGKPREKPGEDEREKQRLAREKDDENWRREHLAIDDPHHPDFQLHAKGSS